MLKVHQQMPTPWVFEAHNAIRHLADYVLALPSAARCPLFDKNPLLSTELTPSGCFAVNVLKHEDFFVRSFAFAAYACRFGLVAAVMTWPNRLTWPGKKREREREKKRKERPT